MNKKTVITGLLVAVAAGVVTGILLAPYKGSKTRKKISKKVCGTTDAIKTVFSNLTDSIPGKFKTTTSDIL